MRASLRGRRIALGALAAWGLAAAIPAPAEASLVVATPIGDQHVATARISMSTTSSRTVVWEQLVLDVASGDLAWVVAVPQGGWIEDADPTWFEALDGASAPAISPARSLGCSDPPPREDTSDPPSSTPPRFISGAIAPPGSGAQAISALTSAGFVVDPATAKRLHDFDATGEQVIALKLPAGARGQTRVLRVVGPPGRPFPLALLPTTLDTRVRGWTFSTTRARLDGASTAEPAFESLAWDGGRSNYPGLLADARALASNGFVVPYASRDGIFSDEATNTTGVTLPSLVRRYFGANDAASSDVWACAQLAASDAAKSVAVAPWCGQAASFASTGVTPSCPDPPPGAVPTSDFVCGAKTDLAAALGGQVPSSTWLTRFEIGSVPSAGFAVVDARLGTIPAFHEAKSLGPDGCNATSSTGTPTSPSTPSTPAPSTPSDDGGTSNDPSGGYDPSAADMTDTSCSGGQAFSDGCSGSSSSGDACSGSSSSSSGGCSGSSSSDSGCGSSDSSGGGCGGSSSSDSGCGSADGGSSGCSGGGGDNGCNLSRGRRPKATVGLYLLFVGLTIARRLGRRRPA